MRLFYHHWPFFHIKSDAKVSTGNGHRRCFWLLGSVICNRNVVCFDRCACECVCENIFGSFPFNSFLFHWLCFFVSLKNPLFNLQGSKGWKIASRWLCNTAIIMLPSMCTCWWASSSLLLHISSSSFFTTHLCALGNCGLENFILFSFHFGLICLLFKWERGKKRRPRHRFLPNKPNINARGDADQADFGTIDHKLSVTKNQHSIYRIVQRNRFVLVIRWILALKILPWWIRTKSQVN